MMDTPHSEIKQFAIKTLNCFDKLAKPEIKNRVMVRVWDYLKNYTMKIIVKKPDDELKLKLFEIYKTLSPLFKDSEMSIEIKKGEILGSPKIPDIGDLAKVKKLSLSANEILKELKL